MKICALILSSLFGLGLGAQAQTLALYQTAVKATAPNFYFTFDGGSLANAIGGTPALSALIAGGSVNPYPQLTYDVFQNRTNCVFFSLQGDGLYDSSDHLISGGGPVGINTSTASGTITLLFRTPDPGPPSGSTTGSGQKYVFSAGGANGTSNALALFIENPNATNAANDLRLAFGDTTFSILPATNVAWDTWYYFALTYNESALNTVGSPNTNKATWYLGRLKGAGTLASGQSSNNTNALAGDGVDCFIGEQTTGKSGLNKPGDGRVDEFAVWNNVQLTAAQITAQFTNLPNPSLPAVAGYQTVISNQAPAHYFQLAGNTVDSMNPSSVALAVNRGTILVTNPPFNASVGFSDDYFLDQNGAAYFALASDAIYTNVNLLNGGGTYTASPGTGKGTITGMFHAFPCTNFYTGEKFIFSAGGSTTTTNALALILEAPPTNANPWSLKFRFGDSSDVLVPGTNILSEWYYFAVAYDETASTQQAQWWVGQPGGTLQSGTFSAAIGSLAGAADAFYLGNDVTTASGFRYQNSSHTGNGQVSQIAIWNQLLTANQIAAQFNALTVSAAPPPPVPMRIVAQGANVIISWPAGTGAGYNLLSTASLASPTWLSAGASAIVGTNYVVTNSISGHAQFYRLTN
jgi:hypothetical protein